MSNRRAGDKSGGTYQAADVWDDDDCGQDQQLVSNSGTGPPSSPLQPSSGASLSTGGSTRKKKKKKRPPPSGYSNMPTTAEDEDGDEPSPLQGLERDVLAKLGDSGTGTGGGKKKGATRPGAVREGGGGGRGGGDSSTSTPDAPPQVESLERDVLAKQTGGSRTNSATVPGAVSSRGGSSSDGRPAAAATTATTGAVPARGGTQPSPTKPSRPAGASTPGAVAVWGGGAAELTGLKRGSSRKISASPHGSFRANLSVLEDDILAKSRASSGRGGTLVDPAAAKVQRDGKGPPAAQASTGSDIAGLKSAGVGPPEPARVASLRDLEGDIRAKAIRDQHEGRGTALPGMALGASQRGGFSSNRSLVDDGFGEVVVVGPRAAQRDGAVTNRSAVPPLPMSDVLPDDETDVSSLSASATGGFGNDPPAVAPPQYAPERLNSPPPPQPPPPPPPPTTRQLSQSNNERWDDEEQFPSNGVHARPPEGGMMAATVTPAYHPTIDSPVDDNSSFPPLNVIQEDIAPMDTATSIQAYVAGNGVVDAEGVAIIDEEADYRREKRRYLRKGLYVAVCLTMVAIAVAVPVTLNWNDDEPAEVVVTATRSPTAAPTSQPTGAPTSTPTSNNFYAVANAVERLGTDMNDEESAGFSAALWMANEDPGGYRDPETDARFLQRYALVAFYFATGGDGWRTCSREKGCTTRTKGNNEWLSNFDECMWAGITCTPEDEGIVDTIQIGLGDSRDWGLKGTLPHELSYLTDLKSLVVILQQIGGTIPPSFGNLTKLSLVNLVYNDLVSPIPPEWLLGAPQMRTIFLRGNLFQGPIPKEFTQVTGLVDVELDRNGFTGTIHTEFGLLPNLSVLHIERNRLWGPIPDELYDAPKLGVIIADGNDLTGSISTKIGQLVDLVTFNVSGNDMDGPIPEELFNGNLTRLKSLDLSKNDFTGKLSSDIAIFGELNRLYLDNNKFNGTVPEEVANVTLLQEVRLHGNDFSGNIPTQICNVMTSVTFDYFDIRLLTVDCDEVTCNCCTDGSGVDCS